MESIQEHPQQPGKILIGYSRGLVILWALSTRLAEQLFLGKQVAILYSFFPPAKIVYYKFQKYFFNKACQFGLGGAFTLFPLSACVAAGESGVGTLWKPVCEFP